MLQKLIQQKTFIVAHRGASAYELENTLEAFKKALELGARFIECDVRLSKDNKLVVFHDANLQRVWRVNANVNELTAEELKKYRVPELSEVIDLLKTPKAKLLKTKLLIEIKEPGLEKPIAEIIKKKRVLRQVVVVSFFEESLKKIKELINVKTGFIFSLRNDALSIAKKINCDWIIPRYDVVTKELVKEAHKNKMKVLAWTVDDKKLAEGLIKLGVDGIASNKPDLLISSEFQQK